MAFNKRKKNSRQRGSHTHGWGAKKKHRGTGNRGGKGMAGTGKRADSKKPSIWAERYFGKRGFKTEQIKKDTKPRIMNLAHIEGRLNSLVEGKLVAKEKDTYIIDSEKLGFDKLLSKGKVERKLKISVPYATEGAIEKVKAAGGEVVGLIAKEKAE
ncbi:uL15 family ribosomal protein [Candidatus Woesearchaeota archaeon]|nr:uL15 family ribosomal protein [Candidatus Woesearchaeota archaeon]